MIDEEGMRGVQSGSLCAFKEGGGGVGVVRGGVMDGVFATMKL
jgi:hypothetical protein